MHDPPAVVIFADRVAVADPVAERRGTGRLAQVSRKCHTAETIERWPDFLDSHRPQFAIQAMCDPAARPR